MNECVKTINLECNTKRYNVIMKASHIVDLIYRRLKLLHIAETLTSY